jgi:glycosyltransferase involved in cell wall biosynthesis
MWVSVAPLSIAAGIQNKILEAMAFELPVVGTTRAVQGLTPRTAAAVDIADDPETMAAKIVPLLQNPRLAIKKGKEARQRVAADYNWDQSLQRLLEIVEAPSLTPQPHAEISPLR